MPTNIIIAFANVIVQSNINKFGKMAVAGCGAYSKIEGFGFLPITCFAGSTSAGVPIHTRIREVKRVPAKVSASPAARPKAMVVWMALNTSLLSFAP